MPQILLLDPWGWVADHDTGWGNRLMAWDFVSHIRETLGAKHEILVIEKEFPEIHQTYLPHTKLFKELNEPSLRNLNGNSRFTPITDDIIIKWYETGVLDLDPNLSYITGYTFDIFTEALNIFFGRVSSSKYILPISLSNQKLNKAVQNYSENLIGIHIRRGSGVYFSQEDWEKIPNEVKHVYDPCFECDTHYKVVHDDHIFDIIDYFLENTSHKIYISIDVDEEAVNHYKFKYPNKIFTCRDFIMDNLKVVNDSNILNKVKRFKNIGYNLIDFFILTNCHFVLQSENSTWSKVAVDISEGPHSNVNDNLNLIIKRYNEIGNIE